jgi:cytosine/adenosine deaminase-related metal-dependent hydrolase
VVPGCGSQGRAISLSLRLSADWLYTGEGLILPFGALLSQNGRIVGTGPDPEVPRLGRLKHFSEAILIPGLVNAHTHLELTGLEGKAEDIEFPDWIRTIIRLKADRTAAAFLQAATAGLHQCFAAGITTIADTGDSGAPFQALLDENASGIAYLEVFGPHPANVEAQFDAFRDRVSRLKLLQTERVRLGVSPHAPYSVSGALYRRVADFAREERLPVAVHIAESAAESELLERAVGPFARSWSQRGIPLPSLPGRTPIAWLEEQGVLEQQPLCIHAIRIQPDDLASLSRYRCSIAHCPRSNRRHGHGDAPLGRFLQHGLPTGVGTDSVASVSPIDLLAEARLARELAGISAEDALSLAMLGAARALRLDPHLGSLAPGKWADCTVIRAPSRLHAADVAEAILASGPSDVIATYQTGREVYRRS